MSRSLRVRQPRTADIRQLHEIFESALEPGQRRRAQAILLYAGLSAVEIARLLEFMPTRSMRTFTRSTSTG